MSTHGRLAALTLVQPDQIISADPEKGPGNSVHATCCAPGPKQCNSLFSIVSGRLTEQSTNGTPANRDASLEKLDPSVP